MTSSTRRVRDTEHTRQLILDAASKLFIQDGYEAVSVRKIAELANLSHGTIYIHFRDKEDLLYQASEEQFTRLMSRLRRVPSSREPLQRLGDALLVAMQFGLDHPNEYQLMMGLQTTFGGPKAVNQWGPSADQAGAFFSTLIADAYEAAAIAAGDPITDERMLLGLMHGVVLEGAELEEADAAALAAAVVETFLAGLRARGGTS